MFFRNLRLEKLKRRREKRAAFIAFLILILSILIHAVVKSKNDSHRLTESLTFLSVIYFYIFVGILLLILLARNLIKAYSERKTRSLGSSLKWKIVLSLVGFSIIPSLVFFVGATALIRSGFEQYFGERVAGALEDSESIVKTHYDRIHRDLDLMSVQVARHMKEASRNTKKKNASTEVFKALPVSRFEIYNAPKAKPIVYTHFESLPPTELELLEKAFQGESYRKTTRYEKGDLIQRFQPYITANGVNVLVLSQNVPMALNSRMEELKSTLIVYRETRTLKNSLKTQYSVVLLVLFVLVLFVVTWFGIYITREITDPVTELLRATNAFRSGRWDYRIANVEQFNQARESNPDLEILKSAFNLMAEEVGSRGKKLEEVVANLEARERYLETLLSSIRRGVVVLDTEGKIQRINKEAVALVFPVETGVDADEFKGRHWAEIFKINPQEKFENFLRAVKLKRGLDLDQAFEVPRASDRDLPPLSLRATGILLVDSDNRDIGTLLIIEDISGATRVERLAAWQGVARRVAHEIKNPLTPIQISADRIARRISRYPEENEDLSLFRECVAQIQKQVRVIRDLVKDFAQFAKLPQAQLAKLDLSQLFESLLKDYRFTHPDIHFEFFKNVDNTIRGDAELLRILFVNIVDNALHSIQDSKSLEANFKGHIVIQIEDSDKSSTLKVIFKDNGPGIDQELKDKIFDPYISTKSSGMGLGLAIVRRIAEEHFGSIFCAEGPGGHFVLELPRFK